jgi:hypothetical protein
MKNYAKKIGPLLVICLITGLISASTVALAAESVSFTLRKSVGYKLGNDIQGDMTITGTGTAGIVKMELYFNTTLVDSSNSNSLAFNFNTGDYQLGAYIITLVGYDSSDTQYNSSQTFTFVSPSAGHTILVIVLGISAAAIVGVVTWRYLRKRRSKNVVDDNNGID